jgi:dolichol kinase
VLIWDVLRINNIEFKLLNFLKFTLRDHETKEKKFSGSFYFMLAVLIVVLFFSKQIAILSILTLVIGDSFAALVGKKYGGFLFKKNKLFKSLNKSIEGVLAFIISSFLFVALFNYLFNFNFQYLKLLIVVFLASIFELFAKKLKIDDNLLITISFAISLIILNLI